MRRCAPGLTVCVLLQACAGAPASRTGQETPGRGAVVATTADPIAAPFIPAADATADTTLRLGVALRLTDLNTPDTTTGKIATPTQSLPPARAAALLEELAGPAPVPPERTGFRFATSSLPAPRPGTTTRLQFSEGDALRPNAWAGPLRIVHTSPRGAVAMTSQVSITFSQPMVALSSLPTVPPGVSVAPAVRGAWRWLDPSTLVFEADGPFPGATRYTVSVPAGVRAASGALLTQPLTWTFATPAAQVRDVVAIDDFDASDPFIVVVLNQRIDASAVLPSLRLEIAGRDVPLRAATAEELEHPIVAWRMGEAANRSLTVLPVHPITGQGRDAFINARLHVAPGLPSLEGPERSEQPAVHEFRIRRSLAVVEHLCGRASACVPGVPWTIRFTHSLRPSIDTASWVRVEPALPGATVEVWNDHIVVLGAPRAGTTYTVFLDSTIASYSGGRLGRVLPLQFTMGTPVSSVWTPGGYLASIPRAAPVYPILAKGTDAVSVEVRAVTPADWPAYTDRLYAMRHGLSPLPPLPGRVLFRRLIPVTAVAGGPGEARVDLAHALEDAGGHALLVAASAADTAVNAVVWVQDSDIVLDIAEHGEALTVRALDAQGRALRDAGLRLFEMPRSLGNDSLRQLATARTDEHGLATLDANFARRGTAWAVVADDARGSVIYSPGAPGISTGGPLYQWLPSLRSHFLTDRPIYGPGDTVRFAGWLRRAAGTGNEPTAVPHGQRVTFTANDPRGTDLVTDTVDVLTNGRVEGEFAIPLEANAGFGHIQFTWDDGNRFLHAHVPYEVQEVRRPNFDVAVELDAGPYSPGSRIVATMAAHYFTGGAVPNADAGWLVSSQMSHYTPPGVEGYSFGLLRYPSGRWHDARTHPTRTGAGGTHRLAVTIDSLRPHIPMQLVVQATVTDVDRQSRTATRSVLVHPAAIYVGLRTPTRFVRQGEPLTIDALVVDLEGRPVAQRPMVLRALRQQRRMEAGRLIVDEVERGRCALVSRLDAVRCTVPALPAGDYMILADVSDSEGRHSTSELAVRVAGETIGATARARRDTVAVLTERTQYEPGDTARVLIETSLREAEALLTLRRAGILESHTVRVASGVATWSLPIRDAHVPNVIVHASVVAPDGRMAAGETRFAVARVTRTLTVEVEPAARELAPGAATSITVAVRDADGRPVENADIVLSGVDEALLALTRRPVRDPLEAFYPESWAAVIDHSMRAHAVTRSPAGGGIITGVVIDAVTGRPLSGVWVETSLGTGAWTGANGRYRIEGAPPGRHRVQARAEGYVSASVENVALARSGAAQVHFALFTRMAVLTAAAGRDGRRGVLGQLGYDAPASVVLSELLVSASKTAEVAVAVTPAPAQPPGDVLRTVFTPVAAFVTDARTGADGRVAIPVTLPHSLTRYRLHAVAAQGDRRFGAGESTLTARRPLMVRPMPPRFLHRDDRFELTVLVENPSDVAREVEVAVRAVNAQLTGPAGRRVQVPAADRVEVRFPAVAGAPGTATFQVVASGGSADAAEVSVPVLLPAVTQTLAVYGQLDDGRAVSYPLGLPTDAIPEQTRIDIGFATTAVHGLRDALTFLIDCFFELPEVYASRIIAISALRNAPAAAPWPVEWIDASIRADLTVLARAQLADGGWSIWAARFDADPFISVHAAHALARARALGHDVPTRTLTNATRFLERLDEHAPRPDSGQAARPPRASAFRADYPLQARLAVQAYALDVRRRLGQEVAASAAGLLQAAGAEALPAEALAWLLPSLSADKRFANDAADVRRELDARIVRSAGTAAVVSPYQAGAREILYSARRTDAVVLAALVQGSTAADELVAAMARGLMAHRVRGRWANTQENAFAVAALVDYLAVSESTRPDLVARAWTGMRLAAQHEFSGRSDERAELAVPADSVGSPGSNVNVTLAREGRGRLYYRVALQHAAAGNTPPVARGFEVARSYEPVDDPADVQRDPDGNWRIRLGARVRVRLTLGTAGPRYHVAVIDPLPAAFEAINPALAGTAGAARAPVAAASSSDRTPFHAEHVNVRADRFEVFRTRLEPGRYEFTYLSIATTPGDFAAPATRVEEMYAPETYGRGAAVRVIVEAR